MLPPAFGEGENERLHDRDDGARDDDGHVTSSGLRHHLIDGAAAAREVGDSLLNLRQWQRGDEHGARLPMLGIGETPRRLQR
jgi:hypothetical protein